MKQSEHADPNVSGGGDRQAAQREKRECPESAEEGPCSAGLQPCAPPAWRSPKGLRYIRIAGTRAASGAEAAWTRDEHPGTPHHLTSTARRNSRPARLAVSAPVC